MKSACAVLTLASGAVLALHPGIPATSVAAEAPARPVCLAADSVPARVQGLAPRGSCAIAIAKGDLDRDGRSDLLLILERPDSLPSEPDLPNRTRTLLVLVSQPGGELREAARSDRAVLCSTCGGSFGDPFEGVEIVRPGEFTVQHHGGSSWRWRADFTFRYSRRDRAWQLVRVSELSYHASDPERMTRRISRPPKHFGRIDLQEFDPASWEGRGPR